jgi:hypothetical protein
MDCEPGKSLDAVTTTPTATDTGRVATISVSSAPTSVLPSDTAAVELAITDSGTGNPLKGAVLTVTSTQFAIFAASSSKAFSGDTLPDDGKVTFRIASTTTGNGSINVRVTSGTKIRTKSLSITVTEKPVAPTLVETLPAKVPVKTKTPVSFTVLDSLQHRPLANAVVTLSSALYTIYDSTGKDTLSADTTGGRRERTPFRRIRRAATVKRISRCIRKAMGAGPGP